MPSKPTINLVGLKYDLEQGRITLYEYNLFRASEDMLAALRRAHSWIDDIREGYSCQDVAEITRDAIAKATRRSAS